MGNQRHIHEFLGVTTIDDGHNHVYIGTTDPAPNGVPHIHEYHTWTNFNDGHRHEIKGRTGPAIPVSGGGHIHYFEGFTSGYPSHRHWYSGRARKSWSSRKNWRCTIPSSTLILQVAVSEIVLDESSPNMSL